MPVPTAKKTSSKTSLRPGQRIRENGRRARKNEGGQAGNDVYAIGADGYNLLARELHSITAFEAMMSLGIDLQNTRMSAMAMVDTEQKQLACIRDLYGILEAQQKPVKKWKNWPADTEPWEIIQWLLRKLGPLAQGYEWAIRCYKSGRWEKYSFVVLRPYHKMYCARYVYNGQMGTSHMPYDLDCFIPLDFLPDLERRDKMLHDLIIDVVALVSKINKVPLWDEDGDFSEMIDFMEEDAFAFNNPSYEKFYYIYTIQARRYLDLINKRKRVVTLRKVKNAINKYQPSSHRKHELLVWLIRGLNVADSGDCIAEHTFVPNDAKDAVTPFRMYKFVWSTSNNDHIWKSTKNKIRADECEAGAYEPMMFSIAKPGEKVAIPQPHYYPEHLYDFMKEGVKIFTIRNEQYFYKQKLREGLTPSCYWYYSNENQIKKSDDQQNS